MTPESTTSRRDFLTTSAIAGGLALSPSLFAGQSTELKIGLVGCGGRGSGAALNALKADPSVKLVALGDMYPDQLQTALKSLRRNGINIVAIHSHMTHEDPRILFFHYWGRGKAAELATAVRAAVALTKTEPAKNKAEALFK